MLDQQPGMEARRRTRRRLWALALLAPLSLLLISGLVNAGPQLGDFTPAAYVYMPIIAHMPTPTRTPTPTPTATPPATATFAQPGTISVSGSLTGFKSGTYATECEYVTFDELIHNDGGQTFGWGILGVSVSGPNTNFFHTSWSAPQQPYQMFMLDPNCYGPIGAPCGSGSAHHDGVGAWKSDGRLMYPGQYRLDLAICLSPYDACADNRGTWRTLASHTITAVEWEGCNQVTPWAVVPAELTLQPLSGCHLDTGDPDHVRMVCPRK